MNEVFLYDLLLICPNSDVQVITYEGGGEESVDFTGVAANVRAQIDEAYEFGEIMRPAEEIVVRYVEPDGSTLYIECY